ncbi:hypothetical protein [Salipiger sp. PrR002]|uniref:hypothetical protein n=1 Tax=Salipiger sp. PrR002 TaxID=2706489 RepID=UPI0013B83960|nr:hypothetical protein [Salipiger sp. PrR002]NDW00602.1 hypothetical protein [Salipiger sp. PrR002]NDW57569.1 hypothetical protein [Salipiger sp. PrR004]
MIRFAPRKTNHTTPRRRPGALSLSGKSFAYGALALSLLGVQTAHAGDDVPPPDYQGRYFITSDGCAYSRAQAYGYHASWHLLLNASVIGFQDAHSGCAAMLDTGVPTGIISTSGYSGS